MTTYHFVTILSFRNYLQDLRLTTMDLLTYVNLLDVSVLNTSDLILDASSVKEKTIIKTTSYYNGQKFCAM